MSDSDPRERALDRLGALRRRFGERLRERLDHLQGLVARAREQPTPAALTEALGAAHRLAGTAGSYGLPDVGEAAAALERALQRIADGDDEWEAALASLSRARQATP